MTVRFRLCTILALALTALCPGPLASAQTSGEGVVEIHSFFVELARSEPTENHRQLADLTDMRVINKSMTVDEMSDFMKSTPWQTKMVYSYSKITGGDSSSHMTPLEFVHSLADDLFQRKALQHFVNKRQKDGLLLRRDIMDWAAHGRRFTEDELLKLAVAYDNNTFKQ